jgi:hypothetical protein
MELEIDIKKIDGGDDDMKTLFRCVNLINRNPYRDKLNIKEKGENNKD